MLNKDLILDALERAQKTIEHMQHTLDQLQSENNHIRRMVNRQTLVASAILERTGK